MTDSKFINSTLFLFMCLYFFALSYLSIIWHNIQNVYLFYRKKVDNFQKYLLITMEF